MEPTAGPAARNLSGITKSRLEAFSDGVLAIVITLLAIELRPPEVEHGESLAGALWDQWPSYLPFVLARALVPLGGEVAGVAVRALAEGQDLGGVDPVHERVPGPVAEAAVRHLELPAPVPLRRPGGGQPLE